MQKQQANRSKPTPSEKYRQKKLKAGVKQMSFLLDKEVRDTLEKYKMETGRPYSSLINDEYI